MKHYDLFAGIGGFSLALDTVFYDQEIEHIFCEWEAFPTAVLKKHWPNGTYYGDIADLIADTNSKRRKRGSGKDTGRYGQSSGEVSDKEQVLATTSTNSNSQRDSHGLGKVQETNGEIPQRDNHAEFSNSDRSNELTILTGGFPCQPFSVAGRRQGTSDDRYKWPDMFRVIRNVQPDWVIAENVRGLVTWNDGMVLETVCTDLESEGYEVQPLIIPAVAVGAPHRRDRVWIVANLKYNGRARAKTTSEHNSSKQKGKTRSEQTINESKGEDLLRGQGLQRKPTSNTRHQRSEESEQYPVGSEQLRGGCWNQDWREVAFATCYDGVDDGLPRRMDGATISASKHRKERLKACGNAIVPQVAMEIFKTLKPT